IAWSSPSVRLVADDARALHFPDGGPVIHDRVMLGAAVIPDRDAVWPPAPAHLVFGDGGAGDQVVEQLRGARRIVLAVADVLRGVEIGEVCREAVDEQDAFAGLRVPANDRVLGVRELILQAVALLDRHSGAER